MKNVSKRQYPDQRAENSRRHQLVCDRNMLISSYICFIDYDIYVGIFVSLGAFNAEDFKANDL